MHPQVPPRRFQTTLHCCFANERGRTVPKARSLQARIRLAATVQSADNRGTASLQPARPRKSTQPRLVRTRPPNGPTAVYGQRPNVRSLSGTGSGAQRTSVPNRGPTRSTSGDALRLARTPTDCAAPRAPTETSGSARRREQDLLEQWQTAG